MRGVKGYLAGLSWMAWIRLLPSWEPEEERKNSEFKVVKGSNPPQTQPKHWLVTLYRQQAPLKICSGLEVQECSERVLTQGNVCDDTAKYERGQKGQGDNEAVEKAVIAFAHTVPDPRAVVIKPFWRWGEKTKNRDQRHVSIGWEVGGLNMLHVVYETIRMYKTTMTPYSIFN